MSFTKSTIAIAAIALSLTASGAMAQTKPAQGDSVQSATPRASGESKPSMDVGTTTGRSSTYDTTPNSANRGSKTGGPAGGVPGRS